MTDYGYLLKEFGIKKVRERFIFLKEKALRFIEVHNVKDYCRVSDSHLEEIIIDYFADVKRVKDFHNIKKIDYFKVAAYTTHWIAKRKPIQLVKDVDDKIFKEKPFIRNINAWYGYCILMSMAFKTERNALDSKELKYFDIFSDIMNYFLTYRVVTPQALELAIVGLCVKAPCDPYFYPKRS